MKKVIACLSLLIVVLNLYAQSPGQMSYQCTVRDASGSLVRNHSVYIEISIVQGSESGQWVYNETQNPTTDANGILSIEIGTGESTVGAFSDINWASGPYFIRTKINTQGVLNYNDLLVGTSQIMSVPNAIYANVSNSSVYLSSFAISKTGDTMRLGQTKIIIPGISSSNHPTVTDADGNSYKTILIGKQMWMAENLKTTKYNDGVPIPNVTDNTAWINLCLDTDPTWTLTGGYCLYNNDLSNNSVYGKLYNFGAVQTGKLCPVGWRVPTLAELRTLGNAYKPAIATDADYGYELMEVGKTHWVDGLGTNESGFNAVPGGIRGETGVFSQMGSQGYYWSSDGNGTVYRGTAWFYPIPVYGAYGQTPSMSFTPVRDGLSIRCIRNN